MAIRHLVGIDIGSKQIKVAQMTENNKNITLTEYAHLDISSQESIPDALKQIFSDRSFKSKRVVTSVSGRNVIIRYIPMAVMDEAEMRNRAKYELGKYIPFEVDEAIFDCQRLTNESSEEDSEEARNENEMRVLLVAARKAFIEEHFETIEHAGLTPSIIDVDSFALGNAYELSGHFNPEVVPRNKIVALIDIGATKTSVNIMNGTTSFFTREFYKGGDDLTDAISKKMSLEMKEAEMLKISPGGDLEQVLKSTSIIVDDICQDINISIDFFENQYDKQVEEILLTGGTSNLNGITESIANATDKETSAWSLTNHINTELTGLSKEEFEAHPASSSIAVGLASRIMRD